MDDFLKCIQLNIEDNIENIILKAEKALFAEKVIDFMMIRGHGIPYRANIHESYRRNACNHFGEDVRVAFILMDKSFSYEIGEIFHTFKSSNAMNLNQYMEYAIDIYDGFLSMTFEAKNFVYYCGHLTKLAVEFYREGVKKAPEFALCAILYALNFWDMHTGRWESLKSVKNDYEVLPKDLERSDSSTKLWKWTSGIHNWSRNATKYEELNVVGSTDSTEDSDGPSCTKKRRISSEEKEISSGEEITDSEEEYEAMYESNKRLQSPVEDFCSELSDESTTSSTSKQSYSSENRSLSNTSDSYGNTNAAEHSRIEYTSSRLSVRRRLF